MSSRTSPIAKFLLSARVTIDNALNDSVIKTALAGYGYTEEKLNEGKTLYNETVAMQTAQKNGYGGRVAATAELKELWQKADQQYLKTLKIARVAFQENFKADKATMLFGDRKRTLSGWLEQAQVFYTNIMNDSLMIDALAKYGYTQAKLSSEAVLLERVAAKNAAQKKETGEAQATTETRNKKVAELEKWVAELKVVAKVALADDPQQLEKLGIAVRTGRTSRTKKQPAESRSQNQNTAA